MADKPGPIKIWDQDATEPGSLLALAYRYIQWMQVKNYSPRTVVSYRYSLALFLQWCEERSITLANDVTTDLLESYLAFLDKRNEGQLTLSTRLGYFSVVHSFFDWMARHNHILYNPVDKIALPKYPRSLPQLGFTQQEVERIINQADIRKPLGIRDRAIMEVLYSSGIRTSELAHLEIDDIDVDGGLVTVMQGKGQKDRMIPLGARACMWLRKYIHQVRTALVDNLSERTLFLSVRGKPLRPNSISVRITGYVKAANIGKNGSCHKFRRSMATLMMDNGADIRYIKEILGHTKLSTTEIYTHVSIRKLKHIHTLTHPGNKQKEL